jgi:hypothetical protein
VTGGQAGPASGRLLSSDPELPDASAALQSASAPYEWIDAPARQRRGFFYCRRKNSGCVCGLFNG